MSGGLRYVYAVCRPLEAPLAADLTGVAGTPVKSLPHSDLVAVVSAVPERDFAEEPLRAHLEDLDWLSATARAHQSVIAALTSVTCPLPLRLATVFRDDSGVRTLLEDEGERFRRTLDRLEGRVEWGVKVSLRRAEAEEPPPRSAATGGRDYLRRRRAQQRDRQTGDARVQRFAEQLHARLADRADASRLHPPQHPALTGDAGRNVLNAAYLVPRRAAEEFVELVDRTKDEAADRDLPGLGVELTGPWAVYSFTDPDPQDPDPDPHAGRDPDAGRDPTPDPHPHRTEAP